MKPIEALSGLGYWEDKIAREEYDEFLYKDTLERLKIGEYREEISQIMCDLYNEDDEIANLKCDLDTLEFEQVNSTDRSLEIKSVTNKLQLLALSILKDRVIEMRKDELKPR